jgi:hypothetical protein
VRAISYGIDGAQLHDNLAAAEAEASSELDYLRGEAATDDGWADDIESIAWALVVQVVRETDREPATCSQCEAEVGDLGPCPEGVAPDATDPEDSPHDYPDYEYTADYGLVDSPTLAEDLVEVLRARPGVWLEVQRRMGGGAE